MVILYWSDDDAAYIAEVPELPGCAADGRNYQEAIQNAEVVIREWIETAEIVGRTVPKARTAAPVESTGVLRGSVRDKV